MDASIILSALQYGADAIAQGMLNETGKKLFESLESKTKAVAPTIDIKAIERSSGPQETKRILLQRISGATEEQKEELANLAHTMLSVIEQHKSAHRDIKVDVIVERVFELFERHSIDRPTMAQVLEVSLPTLKGHGLVDHLDNEKLNKLAATFAVSREWLLGGEDSFGECACEWYKASSNAISQVVRLILDNKDLTIYFVKSKRMNAREMKHQHNAQQYVAVVAEVLHKTPSGQPFKSYQRWESLPWDYQISRTNLLTLAMFCRCISGFTLDCPDLNDDAKEIEAKLKRILCNRIRWRGIAVTQKVFTQYEEKTLLPCELISDPNREMWDIDYYVSFTRLSGTENAALLKEYDYVQEEYQDNLKFLAHWRQFRELIADV